MKPGCFGSIPGAIFFALLSLVAAGGMVLTRPSSWTYTLTIIASTGFVLTAVAGRPWKHRYGGLMLSGLCLCAAGDIAGIHNFNWGAVFFLAAHIAFSGAFYIERGGGKRVVASVMLVILFDLFLVSWLLPHVPGRDRWLVLSYMTMLSLMVVLSSGVRLPAWRLLPAAGAVLFFISDIFVARWKYVYPSGVNAYFCYPMYYLSCVCFALSISAKTRAASG